MRQFAGVRPLITPQLLQDLTSCLGRTRSRLSPNEAIDMALRAWIDATDEDFAASRALPVTGTHASAEANAAANSASSPVANSASNPASDPVSNPVSNTPSDPASIPASIPASSANAATASLGAPAPAGEQERPSRLGAKIRGRQRPPGYQWKSLFLPHGTELRMSTAAGSFYAQVSGDEIFYQEKSVSPRQFTLAVAGDGRNAWRDVSIRRPGDDAWYVASYLRRNCTAAPTERNDVSPLIAMREVADAMEATLRTAQQLIAEVKGFAEPRFDRRHLPVRRSVDLEARVDQLD